ncbi:MAG: DUF4058 family protein [Spirulinaceae cyanobacterium]
MPSPFSGMDPYLEGYLWPDVHHALASKIRQQLTFSDCSEVTPEMFSQAVIRHGLPTTQAKKQVTLHIDDDVLAWFKSQGRSYQTEINKLLRAYMEAHQQ